jgi:hypothetical protein
MVCCRDFPAALFLPRFSYHTFPVAVFMPHFSFRNFFSALFLPHFSCRNFSTSLFWLHFSYRGFFAALFSINNTCPNNLSQNRYSIGVNGRVFLSYLYFHVASSRGYLLTNLTHFPYFRANPLLTTYPLLTHFATNSKFSTPSCN